MDLFDLNFVLVYLHFVEWLCPSHQLVETILNTDQVVLSMGEMLYIPGNWFHYIVSQDASIQCNSRSGMSDAPSSSLGKCNM